MDQVGVKETKEAILAMVVLGSFVALRLKDGAGLDDAMALGEKLLDEAFKAKVMAGVEGLDKIPAELKDLSLADLFELAKVIPDVLEEIKPKAVA